MVREINKSADKQSNSTKKKLEDWLQDSVISFYPNQTLESIVAKNHLWAAQAVTVESALKNQPFNKTSQSSRFYMTPSIVSLKTDPYLLSQKSSKPFQLKAARSQRASTEALEKEFDFRRYNIFKKHRVSPLRKSLTKTALNS